MLRAFPKKTQTWHLKCVECWSAKAELTGFHFSELDQLTQPLPEAKGIVFSCADNYLEARLREDFSQPRSLLVYAMNGKPLSDGHGFPLRVIMPFKYGYKNPKAILEIEYVKNRLMERGAKSALIRLTALFYLDMTIHWIKIRKLEKSTEERFVTK